MEKWRYLFPPHILERGLYYYEDNAVTSLKQSKNTYRAIVSGTEDYIVEIEVNGDSIRKMDCDCPYADGGNRCKHMAAVLYALEEKESADAVEGPAYEHAKSGGQELQDVVNRMSEAELRRLLIDLAEKDDSLRNQLMIQYAETISERQLLQFKREVDKIAYENSGRGGFVDYYHASDYVDGMTDFLEEKVQSLIDKKYYMSAFELTNYVFYCVGNQDMDDSDGGSGWVADKCYECWAQILHGCSSQEQKEMFQWFMAHREGYVVDYMEDYIKDFLLNEFHDEDMLREKMEYLDKEIRRVEEGAGSKDFYLGHYGHVSNILQRIQLMERLGYSAQEIREYRNQFRQFSDIRKLEIQEYVEEKDYANAIRILKESKELDSGYAGLVSTYSSQLMEIYEKIGDYEAHRKELEYYVFQCPQHSLEYVSKLKALCEPGEWEEYRESFLSAWRHNPLHYALLEAEGLYERLLAEVTSRQSLWQLDQYEKVLKERYPEKVRDEYISMVKKAATGASDRKRYNELAGYLKKISRYPDGKSRAKEIAAEWRMTYRRRHAMMEELKKAGF